MKKLFNIIIILSIFLFSTNLFAMDYFIVQEKNNIKTYNVFFDEEIRPPVNYRYLIYTLQEATDKDTFIFHINTIGGDLFSAVEICNAIKYTKAKTIADLYRGFSAGAYITMACQKVIINDFAILMIHGHLQGSYGTIADLNDSILFFKKFDDLLLDVMFGNVLTFEEINSIKNGKAIWLDEEHLFIRLSKIHKVAEK